MNVRNPYAACPLCDSSRSAPARTGDCSAHPLYHPQLDRQMRWRRCLDCGHVHTDGYFTEEACRLVFGQTNAHQRVGWQYEQQRQVWARAIEKVLPWAARGAWLDVGFGNAALLFTAQEFGFEPIGVDLREANVAALAALGIEAHCGDLGDLPVAGRCAVVSLCDVLEHVPFPRSMLRAARRALAPQGVVLLSLPNMDSMLWRALDAHDNNPYWGELEHYHNFGRERLAALLREEGFEPVRYGISERYLASMEIVARIA